ncbi:indole-3-glycerol phosphate lyase, chloroplastic-like [Setaria viridis]|uniref:indole-3-glycerol phosphate lyase, chloroplastic-like n=1 Tax=Setaria viridis TaxID=4556 RepID=UPI003B3AA8A6
MGCHQGAPSIIYCSISFSGKKNCGADVIELGVPFSDPYAADGPVIQASTTRAITFRPDASPNRERSSIKLDLSLCIGLMKMAVLSAYIETLRSFMRPEVRRRFPARIVSTRVESLIQEVKQVTDKPVAVGFGISRPEHVNQIAEWGADGVIIGSAMVRQLGEAASPKEGLNRLDEYARSMKNALPWCHEM